MDFQVFVKPAGAACNLACRYCYYLEKAELHPSAGVPRMPADLLESYIVQHLEASDGPVTRFSWHGGEPTVLGLDYFQADRRAAAAAPAAGPADRQRHPDQRPARGRGVGAVLRGRALQRRPEPRRPGRSARSVSRDTRRRADARARDAGARAAAAPPGGARHPVHGARSERAAPAARLPVLPPGGGAVDRLPAGCRARAWRAGRRDDAHRAGGGLRRVPVRDLRRVGGARHGADRGAGVRGGDAPRAGPGALALHPPRNVRRHPGGRAHRRRLLVRPLRR